MLKTTEITWDVIVIGAGAAGLMAAASAGRQGKRVLILEKNNKPGVKILMSGGSRCNITHQCGSSGIVQAFGKQGKFLHSALAALPPADVISLINEQGVATKTESTGKIFPVSNKAIDVRDALVRLALEHQATLITGCAVDQILASDDRFKLLTADGKEHQAAKLILTSGGRSYPGCGTTGDGYAWARQLGHTIEETFPALTPILTNCQWAHDLKGVTIDPVHVQVFPLAQEQAHNVKQKKRKALADQTGSFLFTHWGFSGPAVLDVSRSITLNKDRKSLELVCDFLPDMSSDSFSDYCLQRKRDSGKQLASSLLADHFPKRLTSAIFAAAGVDPDFRCAELSGSSLQSIRDQVKSARFAISGTLGFEKAEVTTGGVSLRDVDSKTMQSKLVSGLYFAGEILDLDGPIGGYNFQSAFSTGWLAGLNV